MISSLITSLKTKTLLNLSCQELCTFCDISEAFNTFTTTELNDHETIIAAIHKD